MPIRPLYAINTIGGFLLYLFLMHSNRFIFLYRSFGYKAYPDRYYYDSLGLYEVPTKAPWIQNVKASG
jgi:hypothetical protein